MVLKLKRQHKDLLVIIAGLLLMALLFHKRSWSPYLAYAAAAIGIPSLLSPVVGRWVLKAWYGLSDVLGWVNSRILLTIVFYLILSPVALVSRLFRKDALHLKDNNEASLFRERQHTYTRQDLEETW